MKKLDWDECSTVGGDYLNAQMLGLFGFGVEMQFDKTLQEIIDANNED